MKKVLQPRVLTSGYCDNGVLNLNFCPATYSHKDYRPSTSVEQLIIKDKRVNTIRTTVLPAMSDSDFMFCLQSYQELIIDISLVYKSYPQDRINTQVIY